MFRFSSWFIYVPMLLMNGVFCKLLEAPTRRGQKLLNNIAGFRMYLGTAEAETLEKMGAPKDQLNVFEKFLPFAIALGVEQAWSQRFAGMIAEAMRAGEQGQVFSHRWHTGGSDYTDPVTLASSISDTLGGTIASASTPPGSSSGGGGFSGGGFSGGGGGGGGGGGW
jgi:uncharacterized membrane protein